MRIENIKKSSVIVILLLIATMTIAGAVTPAQNGKNNIPVCPPKNGDIRCHSRIIVDSHGNPAVTTPPSGYYPAQFLVGYSLSGTTTSNKTIAIVDAFDDPNIFSDLNTYSAKFGIPGLGSCPVSSGSLASPCFQKVDQRGGTKYPRSNSGWAVEISLDVEIAHAICQNCNILLVEADTNSYANLMTAVDRARILNASVISNSYGGSEFSGEAAYDSHFNYSGIAFTFSSGDSGYGAQYPAASQYVTAVGGTTLNINKTDNSYINEAVWSGTGSGCSSYESKPVLQKDIGCSKRTVADVSADADPNTGAAIYDSVLYLGQRGWFEVGGTSLSSPLIAGVYALSGGVSTGIQGNSIPYTQGNSTNLHDITSGNNGNCGVTYPYLCTAEVGYDGPTGLGTPNGSSAFHQ